MQLMKQQAGQHPQLHSSQAAAARVYPICKAGILCEYLDSNVPIGASPVWSKACLAPYTVQSKGQGGVTVAEAVGWAWLQD